MPHSSGGGSHSSGSSFSSSGGGTRSANYSTRVSKTPFAGCHTYVSYRNGLPVYYYSDSTKLPQMYSGSSTKTLKIIIIIILIVVQAVFIPISISMLTPAKKISEAHTHDDIGAFFVQPQPDAFYGLEEAPCGSDLQNSLEAFQDKTGITPVIYLTYNSFWEDKYASLENFAYELYVSNLPDETYWLIVYSNGHPYYSDVVDKDNWNDWKWEGMQGDDTDPMLTVEYAETFNKTFTDELLKDQTVEGALATAFNKITPGIGEPNVTMGVLVLVIDAFTCGVMLFALIVSLKNSKKYKNVVIVPDGQRTTDKKAIEDRCDYCGGIYAIGAHNSCPHCGAPLSPHYENGERIENKYGGVSNTLYDK